MATALDLAPIHRNAAAARRLEPHGDAQRRRLAAAATGRSGNDLAVPHREAHAATAPARSATSLPTRNVKRLETSMRLTSPIRRCDLCLSALKYAHRPAEDNSPPMLDVPGSCGSALSTCSAYLRQQRQRLSRARCRPSFRDRRGCVMLPELTSCFCMKSSLSIGIGKSVAIDLGARPPRRTRRQAADRPAWRR